MISLLSTVITEVFFLNMNTSLDLTEYKNLDQRTKDLVSGYIRNEERQLIIDIPKLINYICALFYSFKDEWNKKQTSSRYLISDDKVTIQNMTDVFDHQMAFLTNVARMGQHHWKFKINEWLKYYIIIGIVKYEKIDDLIQKSGKGDYLGVEPDVAYCLDIEAAELNIHNMSDGWNQDDEYGVCCKEGDVIDMYLDLDKLELSFAINDTYYGKAFDIDSGFGYVAAASYGQDTNKITLLTYDCNSYQGNML